MKALVLTSCLGIIAMVSEILGFKKAILPIVVAALAGIIFINLGDWNNPQFYYGMMLYDNYAICFSTLVLTLTLIWILLFKNQYETKEFNISDQYALIIFSVVGSIVLSSYSNLVMLFLGIEILSIPMYILAGSRKNDLHSNEASLKYFLMGAFATGILLFGIAMIYGATGSFDLFKIENYTTANAGSTPMLLYIGVLMVMAGLAFKVSAFPFHFWTPDVYQGAPTMVTAFMATIVKTSAFAAFYRLFATSFGSIAEQWTVIISIIAAFTILVGNIIAVNQTNVKRMLAYSGIAQAGYLLIAIVAIKNVNVESFQSLLLYLAAYSLASLSSFAVLYFVASAKKEESFDAFAGLGKSDPILAFIMSASMLSLAGIPPLAGFFAKFYLFANALEADSNNIWIVGIAVAGSLISVYYYFKLIIGMYTGTQQSTPVGVSSYYKIILIITTGIILLIGILPNLIISVAK